MYIYIYMYIYISRPIRPRFYDGVRARTCVCVCVCVSPALRRCSVLVTISEEEESPQRVDPFPLLQFWEYLGMSVTLEALPEP